MSGQQGVSVDRETINSSSNSRINTTSSDRISNLEEGSTWPGARGESGKEELLVSEEGWWRRNVFIKNKLTIDTYSIVERLWCWHLGVRCERGVRKWKTDWHVFINIWRNLYLTLTYIELWSVILCVLMTYMCKFSSGREALDYIEKLVEFCDY